MFREYTIPTHLGSYLAGVATAVLVAIAGWIILQAQPFTAPVTSSPGAANLEALDPAAATGNSDARWLERDSYYEAIGLLPGNAIDYEQAADISAARWTAMAGYYEANGLLTRDPFDYEQAADISAARWMAMGKAYEKMGLLNE
jgi:hypothetical protein